MEESRTTAIAAESAIRKSQLVNWYLEEIAAETLHSEAELVECKLLIERIVDRLVKKVSPLVRCGLLRK